MTDDDGPDATEHAYATAIRDLRRIADWLETHAATDNERILAARAAESAAYQLRRSGTHAPAQIPNLPTDCVVCDGAGCEFCGRVIA